MISLMKPQRELAARLVRISRLLSGIAALVGAVVLAGWTLRIGALKSVLPGLATMKFNTSLSFLLTGFSLVCTNLPSRRKALRRVALFCASIVAVIAVLTLIEYAGGSNFGIDELIFRDRATAAADFPGRMSPITALDFLFLSLASILSFVKSKLAGTASQLLALVAGFFATMVMTSYFYSVQGTSGIESYTTVALHTGFSFVLLAAAALFARPDSEPAAMFTDTGPAGQLLRMALPITIAFPILLGWVRLLGQLEGRFGTEFGVALFATVNVCVYGVLLWVFARSLRIGDTFRKQAEEEMIGLNRALRTISECNQALVRANDQTVLLEDICRILVDHGGYALAWVGYAEQDESKSILPVMHAGAEAGYLDSLKLTWADVVLGRGPTGTAIRSGRPAIVHDINEPSFAPWREMAASRGFASVIALPLIADACIFGALTIYSRNAESFNAEEVKLLEELAGDLAFGITALRRREAHLKSEKERAYLASIVESSDDAVVGKKLDGTIVSWNLGAEKMYGYKAEEVVGKSIRILLPSERATELDDILAGISRGEFFLHFETTRIRKNGQRFPVSLSIFGIRDLEGNLTGAAAVARDITEREKTESALRESEDRYRDLVEHSNALICTHDLDGRLLSVNAEPAKILGYSREELLKMNMRDILAPDVKSEFEKYLKRIQSEGQDSGCLRVLTRDGEARIWEYNNTLRTHGVTKPVVRGLARDITDHIQARKELKKTQEQFLQAQKMEAMGKLAGGVAHDFNNLLTIINGYSEMLKSNEPLGSQTRTYLEEIHKAGDRAAGLTHQLLAFSRRQTVIPKILNLNTVVDGAQKMLRRLISEDIVFLLDLAEELGDAKVDPGQIEQILMNLVVNARDAMPKGGKLIIETSNAQLDQDYVRLHPYVTVGDYVMLAVSDTGVGMSAETKSHIFEPFYTTKEVGKGTGLGLSTVYGIAKQNGGSVSVYSEESRGTTFRIYLPRVDHPAELLPAQAAEEELRKGTETILLVEDQSEVRDLARLALASNGYRVLSAGSPAEAISISSAHSDVIHLLLTDVIMPGMNGRELADQLSTSRARMKVLFVSGYTADAIGQHGILKNGVAFLPKPFTPNELLRKVRNVIDGK